MCLTLAAPEARADAETQGSTEKARRADERYQEGVRAFSKGRYKDAIDRFREADALLQSPALSFNTALAYDKLMDTAGALAHYREYLRREPAAERADRVRERIRELEAQLASRGVQQVTVRSAPVGATVVIDDNPVGVTPWTGELKHGPHQLLLRMPGYYDSVQRLNLAPFHAVTFDLRLNPELVGSGPASASQAFANGQHVAPKSPSKPFVWPWIAFGGSGAALLTAGTFELLREGAEREAKSQTTQIEYQRARDEAETHQRNARIFAGVGGGLAVTGVVLLVALPPRSSERPSSAFACDAHGCFGRFSSEF